jgi:tetraacyldisaccharide 4'-kinase
MLERLSARIEKSWYQNKWWNIWLLPLSAIFFLMSHARRIWLTDIAKVSKNNQIPVVIIGNINVGGTGKTPLTCRLVELLNAQSIKVGIISRGYGSNAPHYPYALEKGESASIVGDEPKLLRDRLDCPIVIGPDRNEAIKLLSKQDVDLILSDDGLQHYKMARDYEIVVLDAKRKLGNNWLLPAGPLREGGWRLKTVDTVILNGAERLDKSESLNNVEYEEYGMGIVPSAWVNAKTRERQSLDFFSGKKLHAVVGIGNPQRFFTTLNSLSVEFKPHVFADHHAFMAADLNVADDYSKHIVMTEKDWVKCAEFASDSMWYLEVNASLSIGLEQKLMKDLTALVQNNR